MEYLSSSTPVVIALASIRTPLTFIGYGIVGLAQLGSTGSIAYRAWIHWRDVREFLHHSTTTRRTIATMGIIIESGVTYLGLLVWYGAITWWGSPRSAVVYTCRFYSVPLIAMYPTLVVILVASRRSVLEGSTGSTLAAHVEEIRFTPNLADKRGCIRCATCVACAARSWSDNGGSGQVDSRRLEIGLDESMAMGNIVPAPNDNESHMSLEHGRSGSEKYRQVLLNGGMTTATHTVDLP
ncbi:hypothetical protein PENSPDRAFT_186365 [Peniophora sp. CONT]|nr:hypothetical protein PENSPDRAFT_186365 [Peniophora sp. CONT]